LIYVIYRVTGKISSVDGYAFIADPTHPNKLTVNLPIIVLNETIVRSSADYEVVETDYTNYALVYSCINLPLVNYKDEFVWILSRTKTLDIKVINNLKEKLTKLGVDTKHLVVIDQSCQ
jgi:lipocalin